MIFSWAGLRAEPGRLLDRRAARRGHNTKSKNKAACSPECPLAERSCSCSSSQAHSGTLSRSALPQRQAHRQQHSHADARSPTQQHRCPQLTSHRGRPLRGSGCKVRPGRSGPTQGSPTSRRSAPCCCKTASAPGCSYEGQGRRGHARVNWAGRQRPSPADVGRPARPLIHAQKGDLAAGGCRHRRHLRCAVHGQAVVHGEGPHTAAHAKRQRVRLGRGAAQLHH